MTEREEIKEILEAVEGNEDRKISVPEALNRIMSVRREVDKKWIPYIVRHNYCHCEFESFNSNSICLKCNKPILRPPMKNGRILSDEEVANAIKIVVSYHLFEQ